MSQRWEDRTLTPIDRTWLGEAVAAAHWPAPGRPPALRDLRTSFEFGVAVSFVLAGRPDPQDDLLAGESSF